MMDNPEGHNESTRREFMKVGAGVLSFGALNPDLREGVEVLPDGTHYDPENEERYISRWDTLNKKPGNLNGIKKDIYQRIIAHTTDEAMAGGDSGGPMFHKDGDFVHMTGLIVGPDPNGSGTRGTTVETIEERLGGHTY